MEPLVNRRRIVVIGGGPFPPCETTWHFVRLRLAKRAWLVHNLVGHPLMQLLALFGCYRKAFAVHEATVPRPTGRR